MHIRTIVAMAVTACSSSPAGPDAFLGFCDDQHPLAPTFTNMQLLFRACTACHGREVELSLAPSVSYANLVNVPPPNYASPPTDESCGVVLVKPGDAAGSYLFQKLSLDAPCAGSRMPLDDIGSPAPLAQCAQTLVHDWIELGAQND
jgi:hypothetical protein